MKQKDIVLIVFVAGLSAIIAFLVATKLIVTSANRQQQVEVVDTLTSEFTQPDKRFFNEKSINPVKSSSASGTQNDSPFTKTN